MRMLAPVSAGIAAISVIVSIVLWRDLRSDRQIIEELRAQITELSTALNERRASPPPAANAPVPAGNAAIPGESPPAQPAKIDPREAAAAFIAEGAKRQEALLKDSEYRKARIEQARINLKRRYNGLAAELGISEDQADAIIDLLAESQIRMEEEAASRLASGTTPDEVVLAEEMARVEQAEQQRRKEALVGMLGATRYEQFQDFEHLQPSRSRVNNLSTLLAREGKPLTTAQARSLTAAIVAEQKRMEQEAQAQRAAGRETQSTFQEREAEANRRILQNAAAFLDAQQLETVRGRFEQRAARGRATERVQQAERAASQ